MGVYVGVKFPLLIALTLLCNALINGVLGLLLGSRLGFRQSILALLMSFSVFALIVGALTPVLLYLMLQLPAAGSGDARLGHAAYLLIHTAIIASAGVVAKVHLYRCLKAYCPSIRAARCTLAAWLGGNAFVGAQFSWILRPFFGSPGLEVAFLREDPMNGTFYEAVWKSCRTVAPESVNRGDLVFCILFISVVVGLLRALRTFYLELTNHEDRRSNHE